MTNPGTVFLDSAPTVYRYPRGMDIDGVWLVRLWQILSEEADPPPPSQPSKQGLRPSSDPLKALAAQV